MKNSIGIRQQIAAATTIAEVQRLSAEAQTYKEISPATLRRIQRTAVKRVSEISLESTTKNNKKGNK